MEREIITEEQFKDIHYQTEWVFKDPYPAQLILSLMFYAGVRRSEIPLLEYKNFDFDNYEIKIINKKGKSRLVELPSSVAGNLYEYFNFYQKIGTAGVDKIFRRLKPQIEDININPRLLLRSYKANFGKGNKEEKEQK